MPPTARARTSSTSTPVGRRVPTSGTSKAAPFPVQTTAGVVSLPVKQPVATSCACVVGGIIDLIGKKWTMCVIVSIGNRPGIRFKALQDNLWGISPRTLSETLKSLEAEGILDRRAFAEIPPRVEYRLTAEGERLRDAVKPLMEYASKRPGAVCPPLVVC